MSKRLGIPLAFLLLALLGGALWHALRQTGIAPGSYKTVTTPRVTQARCPLFQLAGIYS
jgi:hypothetical protein